MPNPIKYGKDNQAPSPLNDSPLLDEAGKKRVQQIVGGFLYYAQAVDPTILMALSEISSQQSTPTENTMKRVNQFLDYMWTHPDAIIRYRASDMILNVHSDTSYLSAPKARSRVGGYFFLRSLPHDGDWIKLNGAIHVTCTILKLVAASAAEAELGALFLNAQEAKVFRLVLAKLGHPQPPTPIHIDNTTTVGIINNTIKLQIRGSSSSLPANNFFSGGRPNFSMRQNPPKKDRRRTKRGRFFDTRTKIGSGFSSR